MYDCTCILCMYNYIRKYVFFFVCMYVCMYVYICMYVRLYVNIYLCIFYLNFKHAASLVVIQQANFIFSVYG